jgi:hypothetical protein
MAVAKRLPVIFDGVAEEIYRGCSASLSSSPVQSQIGDVQWD